jgi:hypothetical protein
MRGAHGVVVRVAFNESVFITKHLDVDFLSQVFTTKLLDMDFMLHLVNRFSLLNFWDRPLCLLESTRNKHEALR